MTANGPSPEVKVIISDFVRIQREKYGDDWKEKLSAEVAAGAAPFVNALLSLRKDAPK